MARIIALIAVSLLLVEYSNAQTDTYELMFQKDGYLQPDSVDDWAMLLEPIMPQLSQHTLCAWFKFFYVRTTNQFWSYCNDVPVQGGTKFTCASNLWFEGFYGYAIGESYVEIDRIAKIGWNLICEAVTTFPNSSVGITVWINGEKGYSSVVQSSHVVNYWPAEGVWILGQDQDNLGGNFEAEQSFSGSLSHINIWSYPLTDANVTDMSTCKSTPVGDVLNWNEAKWNLSKAVSQEMDSADFCTVLYPKRYIMLPEKISLDAGETLCRSMGGYVAMPLNSTENDIIASIGDEFHEICGADKQSGKTLWLGMRRDADWNWNNMQSLKPITYSNFKAGDGGGSNNCAYVITRIPGRHGKWGSAICSSQSPREFCTICEFPTEFQTEYGALTLKGSLTLRGLCTESRQDRIYLVERNGLSKPYFKGPSISAIKWDANMKAWHLAQLQFYAEGYRQDEAYPTGRKLWNVTDPMCGIENKEILLTLTSCKEDEFTCDDGTCVPLDNRCDLEEECSDGSDESNCVRVVFTPGYEKGLAPKLWVNGTKVNEPLPVYFGVDLLSFDQINTIDMMIGLMLRINITWRDSRLQFQNLRENAFLNLVSERDEENLWIPKITFSNSKTGRVDPDDSHVLSIRKDSAPNKFDDSKATEDSVYEGFDNSLVYSQGFYAEYHCTFNLRMFPFDEQICKMEFLSLTVTREHLQLIPSVVKYLGPKTLIEFEITDIQMGRGDLNASRSELRIVIHMSRLYVYHLSKSFFQSFLLGVLAYLTFWIDLEDFTDRFMGGLTALLVLASLMSGLSDQLPKTSYFKVIDFWLLFFLLGTSCIIAVHILIYIYYKEEQERAIHGYPDKEAQTTQKIDIAHINATANAGFKVGVKSKMSGLHRIWKMKPKSWTAKGINDFQKISFPVAFFAFTSLFTLFSYLKVGTTEPIDMEIN